MGRNHQPVGPASKRRAFDTLRHRLETSEPEIRVQLPVKEHPGPDPSPLDMQLELKREADHRAYQVAYERAVRYLAAREHSEQELMDKLRARGQTDTELARQVVEQLKALNLQSDLRFAESLVRSRINRGQGPIRIRQELGRKGIGDELLEEVLTRSGDFWVGIAARAREKRFGDTPPEDRSDWNKQARFLAGRGFPSDLIYRVLGNLG